MFKYEQGSMNSVCNEGGQRYEMFVWSEGVYYNYDGDDQGKNNICDVINDDDDDNDDDDGDDYDDVGGDNSDDDDDDDDAPVMMMMMMTIMIMTTMVMTFVLPTTMIVSLDVNFCKDHRGKIEVPDPIVVEDLISSKLNNKRKLARLITQYRDIYFPIFRKARPPSSGCYRE